MKAKSFAYHGALAPVDEACELAASDILCISDLMQTGSLIDALSRKLGISLRHFRLGWVVFRNRRRDAILVRDFSNIPLLFPFLDILSSNSSYRHVFP